MESLISLKLPVPRFKKFSAILRYMDFEIFISSRADKFIESLFKIDAPLLSVVIDEYEVTLTFESHFKSVIKLPSGIW